ncbi:MAG: UPF0175 family protein [Ruminiclostridium sp.]|nr:UPF0175 family protein [Ruminiclostridium sp.]
MLTEKVEIEIPAEIVAFTVVGDEKKQQIRNAMLVYPYIQNGTISHGRAAQMLGISKIDLITLYGEIGLPYFNETEEELETEIDQGI